MTQPYNQEDCHSDGQETTPVMNPAVRDFQLGRPVIVSSDMAPSPGASADPLLASWMQGTAQQQAVGQYQPQYQGVGQYQSVRQSLPPGTSAEPSFTSWIQGADYHQGVGQQQAVGHQQGVGQPQTGGQQQTRGPQQGVGQQSSFAGSRPYHMTPTGMVGSWDQPAPFTNSSQSATTNSSYQGYNHSQGQAASAYSSQQYPLAYDTPQYMTGVFGNTLWGSSPATSSQSRQPRQPANQGQANRSTNRPTWDPSYLAAPPISPVLPTPQVRSQAQTITGYPPPVAPAAMHPDGGPINLTLRQTNRYIRNTIANNNNNNAGIPYKPAAHHHPRHAASFPEQQPEIPDHENCSFWLTGLPPDVKHADILRAIRNAGRIYALHISNEQVAHGRHDTAGAKVVFFDKAGAQRFHASHVANGKGLLVGGMVARVERNRNKVPTQTGLDPKCSRVLLIIGAPEIVNYDFLMNYFRLRFQFELETVIAHSDGHPKIAVMEWRFASYRAQAKLAVKALRTDMEGVFRGKGVRVEYDNDPCDVGYSSNRDVAGTSSGAGTSGEGGKEGKSVSMKDAAGVKQ